MILGKLKEATREQHENLENTVDVMNQMFSMDNYRTLLKKFYRFYSAIEPELARLEWTTVGYNFNDRLKVEKLATDLENLGMSAEEISKMSKWDHLPKLDSYAEAFGSLYVIEGATLGGQIIKRHLSEHLNLTPENGGLFFNGYGQQTGQMWKEFGSAITAFAEKNDKDETIVESAKETFDSFKACFEQPIH
jgi:heme oxygenase